jgi:integrase
MLSSKPRPGDLAQPELRPEQRLAPRRMLAVVSSESGVLVLEEQKARAGESEWVFPVVTNRMQTKGEKYWEFPDATWSRVLTKANELAKKRDPNARQILGGPHRCRHTYASHFLANKPDLFALGRVLGHSHSRVTEIYSHLLPGHLDGLRNVVTFEPAAVTDIESAGDLRPA